jgi:hypothetical protein
MLRSHPHAEDNGAVAGGDTASLQSGRGVPVSFYAAGSPSGEDGITAGLENRAQAYAAQLGEEGAEEQPEIDFLGMVRECESQALLYVQQANRRAWSQSYRAFHNEHYIGSKYTRPDWRGRSRLFVPKTRAAVRKDNAAVAASLFNSIDAINCLPGDESDPKQRAAAALMEEVVNYRVGGRATGKASIPWFLVAMGARQDAVLTGVCCTKQTWLQQHRKTKQERVLVKGEDGVFEEKTRDVYELEMDRPDATLIPPENYVIDSSADWRNPEQSSAFFIIKWPMQLEEIKAKQDAPVNPWNEVSEDLLRSSVEAGKFDMAAIRRAREIGLDRLDETQTGTHFQVVWVYEVFMRIEGRRLDVLFGRRQAVPDRSEAGPRGLSRTAWRAPARARLRQPGIAPHLSDVAGGKLAAAADRDQRSAQPAARRHQAERDADLEGAARPADRPRSGQAPSAPAPRSWSTTRMT